ncbi:MAG: ATP-binding cassette domain-containing protein [Clostridia bacterium]|nr:ATP-binding cassette domain-containing protein [Clostridia bacterium]
MNSIIKLDRVAYQYHYEQQPLLCDVSFELQQGQRATLLASSQSGKSTIAKLILGLIQPTSGNIYFCGAPYSDSTPDKGILYIPDKPLLFKNKSVAYNVSYPLIIRKESADTIRDKTELMLRKYHLDGNTRAGKLCLVDAFKVIFARADMRTLKMLIIDDVKEQYQQVMDYVAHVDCAVLNLTSDVDKVIGDVIILDDKKTTGLCTQEESRLYVQQHYWIR